MQTGIKSNTAKSAKDLARQIAKQIAQEPMEVLKSVRSQTGAGEVAPTQPAGNTPGPEQKKAPDHQSMQADKIKTSRRMEALNREISDIQKQGLFKDLQRRISEGEEIPLEDYQTLSPEERQVLKAQMEAVRIQKINSQVQSDVLVEPAAKKGRQLFNFGKKTAMKREQTHVEKITPPSG
jgi:hypothetical protein